MGKIAVILIELCASFAGNIQAQSTDYDYYFINGMWTSKDKAIASQMKLNTQLGKESSELLWNEKSSTPNWLLMISKNRIKCYK